MIKPDAKIATLQKRN